MAVKASAEITLTYVIDIQATYRYYLLQSSTLTKPAKPTVFPPDSKWDDTEPKYVDGSTNSLYVVDCTVFCDDTYSYSEVSLSTSYEAAKAAYNKAINAQNTANDANNKIDNLEVGGRNYIPRSDLREATTVWVNSNNTVDFTNGYLKMTKAATSSRSVYYQNLQNSNTFEIGEAYTISAEVMKLADYSIPSSSSIFARCYFTDDAYDEIAVSIPTNLGNNVWTKIANSGSWVSAKTIDHIRVAIALGTTAGGLACRNIKLEKGNHSTDWTPAPEDSASVDDMNTINQSLQTVQESVSDLAVDTDAIKAEVSTIETTVNAVTGELESTKTELLQMKLTSSELSVQIENVNTNGVSKVVTETGFTFDSDGMMVDKTDSDTKTQITSDGMTVYKKDAGGGQSEVLKATSEGVDATNLHAKTYLIIGGRSRFENYGTDRTGCFWIGG